MRRVGAWRTRSSAAPFSPGGQLPPLCGGSESWLAGNLEGSCLFWLFADQWGSNRARSGNPVDAAAIVESGFSRERRLRQIREASVMPVRDCCARQLGPEGPSDETVSRSSMSLRTHIIHTNPRRAPFPGNRIQRQNAIRHGDDSESPSTSSWRCRGVAAARATCNSCRPGGSARTSIIATSAGRSVRGSLPAS
jgi:hypothetical protein